MGIASTPLFTAFVYSQITLFKVRSVKRVWRINAHFRPLRVRKAKGCRFFGYEGKQKCPPACMDVCVDGCMALDLSSAGEEKKGRERKGGVGFIWGDN